MSTTIESQVASGSTAADRDAHIAIGEALQRYFDGLYRSDATLLADVFHPQAIYVTATDGALAHLDMDTYLPIVAARPSPESRNEPRHDHVDSIELAGPVTAFARVRCSIGPKRFTDLLTLINLEGRWQIIAKVFHFDLEPEQ